MPTPTKPILPPFWKWLMRVTFAVTMVLFLAPTVYMVKYYAVDKPREMQQVKAITNPFWSVREAPPQADYLPLMEEHARNSNLTLAERAPDGGWMSERQVAVRRIGETLRQPFISIKRPFECLSAKATLADLATKDKDPTVRAAASEELGKVAQSGGAVIRR